MAELVGLIASIITLTETGFQVARAISRIAGEFGEAGAQIRSIATDARAISFVLRDLTKRLKRIRADQEAINELRDVTAEIVALCKMEIDGIGNFLNGLHSKSGNHVTVAQKTKWLFAKSRISLRQSSLNSLKLTLNLLMHTVNFIRYAEME